MQMRFIPLLRCSIPVAAALVAGCAASVPRPEQQLQLTQTAISEAEGADARTVAPVLLNSAQNKLLDAREAMDREDYRQALWLLQEAEVEAELAQAKALTADARRAVEELERNIDDLRERIGSARG